MINNVISVHYKILISICSFPHIDYLKSMRYILIMRMVSQYRGLPKQIYFLCVVRLIEEMGLMFVFPFLSLLMTQRLGFSTIQAGFLMLITSACSTAGTLTGGKLADEFGRRRICIMLTIIVIMATFAAGSTCSRPIVLLFVIIAYTANSAIVPAASAFVIDLSTPETRNDCFSLLYIFVNVGCSFGPVVAGLLFYNHMKWIFYSMAGLYLIALYILCTRIEDHYIPHCRHNTKKEESLVSITFHRSVLCIFIVCLIVITMCYMQLSYILPIQLSDTFGLNTGSKFSSLLWTINGILCVILTPSLMLIIKRLDPLPNVVIGVLIYIIGFGIYAFPITVPLFTVSTIIWTIGEIFINTEATVFIAEMAPHTHNGRVISLYEFSRGLGKCIGPLIFSYALVYTNYSGIWISISMIFGVIAGILALLHRKSLHSNHNSVNS